MTWDDHGIPPESHARCDEALATMMMALDEAGSAEAAQTVFREALFRVFELPKRTPEFQASYLHQTPEAEPCPTCLGAGKVDDRGFALVGQPFFDTKPCPACQIPSSSE